MTPAYNHASLLTKPEMSHAIFLPGPMLSLTHAVCAYFSGYSLFSTHRCPVLRTGGRPTQVLPGLLYFLTMGWLHQTGEDQR